MSILSVKVKICGITNQEDAQAAVDMGADILGFNFYPRSPRYIEVSKTMEIINQIPTYVDTAGILVNPTEEQIGDISEIGFLNWIQFHGDETPEFCNSLTWLHAKTIKALRIRNRKDLDPVKEYRTDAILLDCFNPKAYGGTGERFDWDWIDNGYYRFFLAGGITADNAAQAIETGVFAIDVCSGIEATPGRKDHQKMKQLFENIKHLIH
ncbi:MAG: phosphoribosylanthranilate isomerase [Sedimentisphaerales bacterium]|nr:phosphoribosylanthranilate isomerase [Sedimentisphaerales bacterium]